MLPAKTRRRTRRAECKAFREGTYRRGVARSRGEGERERERGDPRDDNVSQWARSLARFFFFPSLLLPRRVIHLHTVSFPLTERKRKGKEKKVDSDIKVALAAYSPHLIISFLALKNISRTMILIGGECWIVRSPSRCWPRASSYR